MRTQISGLQRFVWWMACTDEEAILLSSPLTQFYQTTAGTMIVVTGLFAFVSGGYGILQIVRNVAATLPLALIWTLAIVNIDRFIVSGRGRRMTWVRMPLAFLIGWFIAVPLELRIVSERIDQQFERQARAENQVAHDRRIQQGDDLKGRIDRLEQQADKYRAQIAEWGTRMEAEVVGRVRTGSTGIAGSGPAYKAAEQQRDLNAELLRQVTAELERLRTEQASAMQQIDAEFKREYIAQPHDLVAQKEALAVIESEHPEVAKMTWGITLLLMLIEVSPALLKLLLPYTGYAALIEAREREDIQRRHSMANHNIREMVIDPYDETLFVMRQTANVQRAGVADRD